MSKQQENPETDQMERLLDIMANLRNTQSGCAWDIAQTFTTIAPYTIEDAYEVADAIERSDHADLQDELGDLLFQVVFHARMAEEAGYFDFGGVAQSISDKMEARHPHIFGDESGTMGETRWETLKAAERDTKGATSAVDGVAKALPALMRAQKLQKRAARTGFDWPDTAGPTAKIHEEIKELKLATSGREKTEEAGDFLFAAVNLVRAYGIDAEEALRAASTKFERRFREMEALGEGKFGDLKLDEQEAHWQRVKTAEKRS